VLGGRHYVTFDRRRFSFASACAYTLVQVSAAAAVAVVVAAMVAGVMATGSLPGAGGSVVVSAPQDFVEGRLLITAKHESCDGHQPLGCHWSLAVSTHRTTARLRGTGDRRGPSPRPDGAVGARPVTMN